MSCSRNNTASIHTSIDDSVVAWQGEKLRLGTGTSPTKLCLRKRYVLLYDRQSSCGCIRGGGTLSDHEVLTCAYQITQIKTESLPPVINQTLHYAFRHRPLQLEMTLCSRPLPSRTDP